MDKETDLVMDYERKQGRNPEDVSRKRDVGCDIKSGDRFIEVKKRDIKYGFVVITKNEFQTFLKNKNTYLYLVYYIEGKPKLKIFDRDVVLGNSQISVSHTVQIGKAIREPSEEIDIG